MTTKAELEDALRERDERIMELKAEKDKKAELEDALRERDKRIMELKAEKDKKAELEDALRERDKRIMELKAENDKKAELEDALRERDRQIMELKAENDKQAELIRRQREKLEEVGDVAERSATGAQRPQTGQLLEIIQANPGLTAVEIHRELAKRSWAAQRFGNWAAMFGPTYGALYVALAQLTREGSVNVNHGETTAERRQARGRPLRFYARPTHATEPL